MTVTIECNWLDGGGYALNIRGTGATVPKNTRITDNRFGRSSGYGPWTTFCGISIRGGDLKSYRRHKRVQGRAPACPGFGRNA